jgi:hypothetical protein
MPNVKVQVSDEIQSPEEKSRMLRFDIDLAFASLPVGWDFEV